MNKDKLKKAVNHFIDGFNELGIEFKRNGINAGWWTDVEEAIIEYSTLDDEDYMEVEDCVSAFYSHIDKLNRERLKREYEEKLAELNKEYEEVLK
jgi:hypothetical protein